MEMSATGAQSSPQRDAMAAIFRHGGGYAERLPMLPAALERVAHGCTEELGTVSALQPNLKFIDLESGRVADLLEKEGGTRLAAMVQATAWDADLLVSLDREFIYAYVDLVFGGDGSQLPYSDPRPLSRIETRIAQTFLARLNGAMSFAFEPFMSTEFAIRGELGRVDQDRLGGPAAPVAIARYRLEAGRASGELRVAIPDAALTAIKPAFARPPRIGIGTADPGWTRKIHHEVNRTRLAMRAVLEEQRRPLADVAGLQVGQILMLDATPRSPVRVDCNGEPLLWCEIGQSDGAYTLRVQGFVDREQEFMDDILSG